jgi:hypothetical protein
LYGESPRREPDRGKVATGWCHNAPLVGHPCASEPFLIPVGPIFEQAAGRAQLLLDDSHGRNEWSEQRLEIRAL